MDRPIEWHFWSAEQIADTLPDFAATIESRLGEFPEEHREKNRTAVLALRADPPTAAQVRDLSRSRDLLTVGFALDVLGRRTAGAGQLGESLRLFQAAHEVFRGGNPLLRPTKPMRQTLSNALKVYVLHELARCQAGETTVGAIRETVQAFVRSAWGAVPPPLVLNVNELLLGELERIRAAGEADPAFHERIVRDNIETVLALEVPTRLEKIRRRWEEIGEQVAPAAARRAQRGLRRPEDLSVVVPPAAWSALRQAVERGDVEAMGQALEEVADDLETNLRLRLDAKPEYREPASELRATGGPDPAFVEARALLLRQDPAALDLFNDIHYRRSHNTIAKEWYAYALSLFGRATDIHDIVDLLEDAIASERFRPDRGWTARWNLACALRRLPARAAEALDVLLPALEADAHTSEVFECCLLWALEQGRQEVLASLFLKSRYHEAHLLAALQDVEAWREGGVPAGQAALRDHFRRINRILRDPDRIFPDPRERQTFDELDQLTRDFVETSLVEAGVEWFRQRVAYGSEGRVFKNWECAAALNEAAGDRGPAWRCRQQSWRATQHKKNVDPRKKTQVLRALLGWGQRHGFADDALRVLKQSWRDTSMSEADARMWEERLGQRARPAGEPETGPGDPAGGSRGPATGFGDPGSGRTPAAGFGDQGGRTTAARLGDPGDRASAPGFGDQGGRTPAGFGEAGGRRPTASLGEPGDRTPEAGRTLAPGVGDAGGRAPAAGGGEPAGRGPAAGPRVPEVSRGDPEDAGTERGPAGVATWAGRRAERRGDRPEAAFRPPASLALMLDWENIKISLAELLDELPEARAQALRPRLGGAELAARLRDAAGRHGLPRQRWAVADWDRPSFEGDQKAVRLAGYFPDIAGAEKFDSSDHVLREKIHLVLREHPEIAVYVIATGDGDFHEAIRTLQQQGKQVILWSTRRAVNGVYGASLTGVDRIQIEWLEDLVFGELG